MQINGVFVLKTTDKVAFAASVADAIQYVLASLPPSQVALLGYSLYDELLACTYSGAICRTTYVIVTLPVYVLVKANQISK